MREFDDLQVRQLLEFVTSSDRVPVNGVGSINFTIQKNGDEDLVSTLCPSPICPASLSSTSSPSLYTLLYTQKKRKENKHTKNRKEKKRKEKTKTF